MCDFLLLWCVGFCRASRALSGFGVLRYVLSVPVQTKNILYIPVTDGLTQAGHL